ncbi:MAG: hypothetical protein E4G96_01255 [Chrysiogenales bacterium]|nr:MAG: hypothetical protein E4G96_01255 [Chrysiogenales bacterium]
MKSGARFVPIDRVWQVHSTKAKATMAQDRIGKLVFEYYQFNMSNNVREEKIFISTSPDSGDLRTLQMKYSSNDGEAMQYTVGDLQKSESQKALAGQYYSNYLTLVFLVEQYGSRSARKESQRIDRTIQLGE